MDMRKHRLSQWPDMVRWDKGRDRGQRDRGTGEQGDRRG